MSGTGQGRRFDATARDGGRGRLLVPVPFDPDQVWGSKPRHHVGGTLDGFRVRGVVEAVDGGFGLTVGAAWVRDCPVSAGDKVAVEITPEGPQRGELAEDVAAALDASPRAGEFFDGLAQFYRKGYLRCIDATKRRPEERAARIAEFVRLLEAGKKERPKQ